MLFYFLITIKNFENGSLFHILGIRPLSNVIILLRKQNAKVRIKAHLLVDSVCKIMIKISIFKYIKKLK